MCRRTKRQLNFLHILSARRLGSTLPISSWNIPSRLCCERESLELFSSTPEWKMSPSAINNLPAHRPAPLFVSIVRRSTTNAAIRQLQKQCYLEQICSFWARVTAREAQPDSHPH